MQIIVSSLVFLLIAVATGADTNVPSRGNSTVPHVITLVGTQDGVPHPGYEARIVVRDFLARPIPGANVLIDFNEAWDVRLCTVVGDGTFDCQANYLIAPSDANGEVHVTLLGAGTNSGSALGDASSVGLVFADGVPLGLFTMPVLDQNGAVGGNGVNGTDLALALSDVLRTLINGSFYLGRSDYDGSRHLNGADLAFLLRAVNQSALGLGSASGCANAAGTQPYCP